MRGQQGGQPKRPTGCSSSPQTHPQWHTHSPPSSTLAPSRTGRVPLLCQSSAARCCLLQTLLLKTLSILCFYSSSTQGAKHSSSPKQTKPFFPGYLHPYDFMVQACLGNSFEFLLEFNLREKNCPFLWKKYHVFFSQVMTIAWPSHSPVFLGARKLRV